MNDSGAEEKSLFSAQKELAPLPLLSIPTDRPRSVARSGAIGTEELILDSPLTRKIYDLCERERIPITVIMLTSLSILLAHYADQNEIVIGVLFADQHSGAEQYTSRWLRTNSVRTLSLRDTLEHISLGFQKIENSLVLREDSTGGGVENSIEMDISAELQVLILASRGTVMNDIRNSHFFVEKIPTDIKNYEWVICLNDAKKDFILQCYYNADLFESSSIRQMLGYLQAILLQMCTDTSVKLSNISLLSIREREEIISKFRGPTCFESYAKSIQQLFEEQVEHVPSALAVSDNRRSLSYEGLNLRANNLALRLRTLGVKPEVPVGLYLERSTEMVISLLGIVKAGGVFIPLELSHPQERIMRILEDANIEIVITKSCYLKTLSKDNFIGHRMTITVDDEQLLLNYDHNNNPLVPTTPEHLFYVMYTSGSTGNPKGVSVTQQRFLNRISWRRQNNPLRPTDRIAQRASISYDVAIAEIFEPLLSGASLIILDDEVVKDPILLINTLSDHAVTHLEVVPSLLKVMLETQLDLSKLMPNLTNWSTCGEPLPLDLFVNFRQQLPHSQLLNDFGSTETGMIACNEPSFGKHVHAATLLATPIAETQLYVLSNEHEIMPPGIIGELYIGGLGLARGYYQRADLTASQFIPDPFNDIPGSRLYRSGELARYRADGMVELIGRSDTQIKLRGIRVELGEIEYTLRSHVSVQDCVIISDVDPVKGQQLIAYIVLKLDTQLSTKNLQDFLRTKVPGYMIPNNFMYVSNIPLSANGKVDRRALTLAPRVRSESNKMASLLEMIEHLSPDEVTAKLQHWKESVHNRRQE